MSEQEVAEEQTIDNAEELKPTTVDMSEFEELSSRLDSLKATNERLLKESRENKSKYKQVKTEQETKVREDAESKQKWETVAELRQKENRTLIDENKTLKRETLTKSLHFQVAQHANDANNVQDIIRALDDHPSLVQINEEELEISGVKEAVDKIREEKSYMFKKDKPLGQMTARPRITVNENKKLSEMTNDEKFAVLQKALPSVISHKR